MSTGIVVGATGGIGAACARALAGTADRIVLTGRRRDALEQLAAETHGEAVAADIATADGREAVAGERRELGAGELTRGTGSRTVGSPLRRQGFWLPSVLAHLEAGHVVLRD